MKIILLPVVVGAAVLLATSGSAATESHVKKPADTPVRMAQIFADFKWKSNIVYKTVADQALLLDLLLPKNLPKKPAPLLVYIHGGGWVGGNRYRVEGADMASIVHRCGKEGIACATIEYRFADGKSTVFDSVVDCKDAVRFLVKHAADYQIDPQRIAIFGSSAGGHLSLVTALGKPRDFPGDPALADYDPPALRGEVAFYPATDFSDTSLAERFLTDNRAKLMFGGSAREKAAVIRLLSPICLIERNSPPVYLFHGDKDTILSVENSRRLFAKGKAVGAAIQFTEVKGAGHGFSLAAKREGPQTDPSAQQIADMAAQFFIEHLTP